jgi:acyl carrier protein
MKNSAHSAVERTTLDQLKDTIVRLTNLQIAPSELPDNAHLFDDCGLDSTTIVNLVLEVEVVFGISLVEDDLDAEVLRTVSSLAAFIDSRLVARDLA